MNCKCSVLSTTGSTKQQKNSMTLLPGESKLPNFFKEDACGSRAYSTYFKA